MAWIEIHEHSLSSRILCRVPHGDGGCLRELGVAPGPGPAPTPNRLQLPSRSSALLRRHRLVRWAGRRHSAGPPSSSITRADQHDEPSNLPFRDFAQRRLHRVEFYATVSETPDRTSYTPSSTSRSRQKGCSIGALWPSTRRTAVQSSPSVVQSFTYYVNTQQNRIAAGLYNSLWSGARPTGTHGRAAFGRVGRSAQSVVRRRSRSRARRSKSSASTTC